MIEFRVTKDNEVISVDITEEVMSGKKIDKVISDIIKSEIFVIFERDKLFL